MSWTVFEWGWDDDTVTNSPFELLFWHHNSAISILRASIRTIYLFRAFSLLLFAMQSRTVTNSVRSFCVLYVKVSRHWSKTCACIKSNVTIWRINRCQKKIYILQSSHRLHNSCEVSKILSLGILKSCVCVQYSVCISKTEKNIVIDRSIVHGRRRVSEEMVIIVIETRRQPTA